MYKMYTDINNHKNLTYYWPLIVILHNNYLSQNSFVFILEKIKIIKCTLLIQEIME